MRKGDRMNTIVLYATKHGASLELARKIASQIGSAKLVDLNDIKRVSTLDLSQFDCVIVGSSVYAGQVRPAAKHFVTKNADLLMTKRLGLFIVGLDTKNAELAFASNFPKELRESAQAQLCAGGIFDPEKANFAERRIVKAILKSSDYVDTFDDEKIASFVQELRKSS